MTRDTTSNDSTDGSSLPPSEQRTAVRQRYGAVAAESDEDRRCEGSATAQQKTTCCGEPRTGHSACCDDGTSDSADRDRGYSRDDVAHVADGANLGLGCGNPTAIADLNAGETVLDLGSGGGFDCFLAARAVGEAGAVIGVDMTPEMIDRARANVEKNEVDNVEFRLGEIEALPVPDDHVDVIISNCVINLSPEKRRVFEEAYRVLRPGGRLAIADVVLTADSLPERYRDDPESVTACIAGASMIDDLQETVERAGFESVSIRPQEDSKTFIREWSDDYSPDAYVVSAVIEGEKPREVAS